MLSSRCRGTLILLRLDDALRSGNADVTVVAAIKKRFDLLQRALHGKHADAHAENIYPRDFEKPSLFFASYFDNRTYTAPAPFNTSRDGSG